MKEKLSKQIYYDATNGQRACFYGNYYERKYYTPWNIHIFEEFESVDIEALNNVFCSLIQRHDIFRTSLLLIDGNVKQRVYPYDPSLVKIHIFDLKNIQNKKEELEKIKDDSLQKNFKPDQYPWLLVKLVLYDEKKNYLSITIPHNISDNQSINIIKTELFQFYKSHLTGENISLTKAFQYKDYVTEINEILKSSKGEEHKSFWENRLNNLPKKDLTSLLSYNKQNRIDSYKKQIRQEIIDCYGKTTSRMESDHFGIVSFLKFEQAAGYVFYIDSRRLKVLKKIAMESNVLLSVLIMATFHLLIYKLTGESDVIIGVNLSLRDSAKINKMIGFLTNTVLVRCIFENSLILGDFVKKINSEFNTILRHKIYPFEKVLYDSDISFQRVSKLFLNIISSERIVNNSTDLKPKYIDTIITPYFDIDFNIKLFSNIAEVQISYNTKLFKKSAIELISSKYLELIDNLEMSTTKKIMDIECNLGDKPNFPYL